jgi:hypothetical protein
MEAHRIVRQREPHILYTVGLQIAVRLSALRADRALFPKEDSWYYLLETESTSGP